MRNAGPGKTRKEALAVSGKTLGSGESEPARKVSVRKLPGMTARETGHTMTPPGNGKATDAVEAVNIATVGDITMRRPVPAKRVPWSVDLVTTRMWRTRAAKEERVHTKIDESIGEVGKMAMCHSASSRPNFELRRKQRREDG